MSPELAIYYRRMLSVDIPTDYEQYIDLALEQEAILSELLLELACSLSDWNRTISLLDEYLRTVFWEEQKVYARIIAQLRVLCRSGELSYEDGLKAIFSIFSTLPFEVRVEKPWIRLYDLEDDYLDICYGYYTIDWILKEFQKLLNEEVNNNDTD